MRNYFLPFSILFFTLLSLKVFSQDHYFEPYQGYPIIQNGEPLTNGWAGGLNAPQFSKIDVDRDGDLDLFIQDRGSEKIEVFLWDENENKWRISEKYDDDFPADLGDWTLLRDLDRDGNMDIFTSTNGSIGVYRNVSTGQELEFELMTNQVLSDHQPDDTSNSPVNIYVPSGDIPAIDDIDEDGDLDILSFSILGSVVQFHRNLAMEQTGSTDTLIYQLRNKCWGFFSESGINNTVNLNDSCSNNISNPESGGGHSGSSLTTLDMNGDQVKELILGDLSFPNLVLLTNDGGSNSSHMAAKDTTFPNPNPVDLDIFPAAYHLDVNNDSIRDLLVSPNKGAGSENHQSVWLYENQGNDSIPNFQLQNTEFLQDSMIDLGEGAFPVLFDHEGDGDKDLFVGNVNYYSSGGNPPSRVAFFENTGTPSSPEFTWITDDYENLSSMGMGQGLHPSFGDLDGDGDKDMMVGASNGYVHYFENTAGSGSPASFSLNTPNYPDINGDAIDVGDFAAPRLIDLNRDNKLDLVIGEKSGNLNYYQNVGTTSNPSFKLIEDTLGGVVVAEYWDFEGFSVPAFFEDNGSWRLMVGSKNGYLHYYKDIDGNLQGDFQLVDSTYFYYRDGKRSAPTIHDLDNDGYKDMILGDLGGGVTFLKGMEPTDLEVKRNRNKTPGLKVFPNPVVEDRRFRVRIPSSMKEGVLEIRNIMGEVVHEKNFVAQNGTAFSIYLSNEPAGVYLIRAMSNEHVETRRIILR